MWSAQILVKSQKQVNGVGMRPALRKCVPSHLVLLDFLAPRLYATSRTRPWSHSTFQSVYRTPSCRCNSTSATAVVTTTKPSIFDATHDTEGDLSYHVAQMHKAALEGDVLGVWSAYGLIHSKNARLVLGPQQYGAISLMLVKLFAHVAATIERSEEELHAMEELAFVCAGAGRVEGLRQMLLWLVAKNETKRVFDAFERFERTVLILDESGLEKATGVPDEIALESDSDGEDVQIQRHENPDISRMDVASIMAITVAAYAAEERFYDALHFIIAHPSYRITGDNLDSLKDELKACGCTTDTATTLELETRRYIDSGNLARLVQSPEAFKAHLRNLMKEKRVPIRLEKVRLKLKTALSGKFAWAAVDEAKKSPTRPIVVSEKIWSYFIHAYMTYRHDDFAKDIWADFIRFGGKPGIHMWNALLEGFRDTGRTQKLLQTWQMMKKEGIPHDARSYGAKLGCLYQDMEHRQYALKQFEEFRKTNPSPEDSLFVFNTVLNGLLAQRDSKGAAALLDEMKTHGPKPDIVSYNTFIAYYAKTAKIREIGTLVRQLTKAGIEPDVFTFTSILSAFLRAEIPDGTERLLAVMSSMGIKQNVATYSAIIDAQVRDGTKLGITAAWELLQQMERMKDVKPNIVTYTSFLAGIHRSKELDKDLITAISSDIVKLMKKRDIRIKLGTYHILFKACLENPNREALNFFMDYYNMSQRNEIPFRHDTWYVILDGLVRREEWKLASEMKRRMLESGFQPMWGVLRKAKLIRDWEVHQMNTVAKLRN